MFRLAEVLASPALRRANQDVFSSSGLAIVVQVSILASVGLSGVSVAFSEDAGVRISSYVFSTGCFFLKKLNIGNRRALK